MTEEKKEKFTKEERAQIKRRKDMAFFKASQDLLRDAQDKSLELLSEDDENYDEIMDAYKESNDYNAELAKSRLGASQSDIDNAQYSEVKDRYKRMYEKHLKKIGKTDADMHRRALAENELHPIEATLSSDSQKDKSKFSFSKKKDKKQDITEDMADNKDEKNLGILKSLLGKKKKEEEAKQFPQPEHEKFEEEDQPKIEEYEEPKEIRPVEKPETMVTTGIDEYKFDASELSPQTRYDFIELPSKGECYKHKKRTIPVRELTASDENLIASPNMYSNGQLIDAILRRCILDKNFRVDEMVPGDRDAVVLWLRGTAYGTEYDITTTNNETGKTYTTQINLADFKYKEFNLKGDENGYFDYTFENGDVAKFKFLSFGEMVQLQEDIALQFINQKKFTVFKKINEIKAQVDEVFKNDSRDDVLDDAIDYIYDWSNNDSIERDEDDLYVNFMTTSLIRRTMSINGSSNPEYISSYVNNMRIAEAKKYREYIFNSAPGYDFSIHIDIPESEGGGSFDSTFQYGNTIFLP